MEKTSTHVRGTKSLHPGKLTRKERLNICQALLHSRRIYPEHANMILKKLVLPYLFDTLREISPYFSHRNSKDMLIEWINVSKEDLRAVGRLYDAEDALSLYHLQQCVEKASKSTLLLLGWSEQQVINYKHRPDRFILDILERGFHKLIVEKFPLKGVKRPEVDDAKVEELKNFLKSRDIQGVLKEEEGIINAVTKLIDVAIRMEPNYLEKEMVKYYDRMVSSKAERRKIEKSSLLNVKDWFRVWKNYMWLLFSFVTVIILLLICVWPFESITRYPDERRKIRKDFKEFMLYKQALKITNFLDMYIRILENAVNQLDEIDMLVCHT